MCLGAAGCGYEFAKPEHKCGFLTRSESLFGEEFVCAKYYEQLQKDLRSGHPLRSKTCSEDAWKDAESKLAIEKKRQTLMDRQELGGIDHNTAGR